MYRSNLLPKLYLSQSDTKLNNTNYSCPQLYPATPIMTRSVRLPSISSNSSVSDKDSKIKTTEIMPQYRRMQILEEKIRLLENRNISNNEQLKTMIENDYLEGRRVSFIKMDVEGAEMDVLKGMKYTIQRYKPKMAVCIYHKYQDIYDITAFLKALVPNYKFYFRHYNSNETECVLFCQL